MEQKEMKIPHWVEVIIKIMKMGEKAKRPSQSMQNEEKQSSS